MIIWAAFKGMVVLVKKSHQQLRIKISFYTMFHLKAYSCWKGVFLCWILKRIKKQPRDNFKNHIVFKENLHCRTTTSTCGRRWKDFTGSLKPSKDSLLKRKSDCQQNLSSISSQKRKKICKIFACTQLYEPSFQKRKNNTAKQIVWQILLVPGTLWAQLSNKKGQQRKIHFLPAAHCLSLSVMGNRYKAAVSDAIKVIFANDCKNLRRRLQSEEENNVCLVAPLTWVNIVNLANLI